MGKENSIQSSHSGLNQNKALEYALGYFNNKPSIPPSGEKETKTESTKIESALPGFIEIMNSGDELPNMLKRYDVKEKNRSKIKLLSENRGKRKAGSSKEYNSQHIYYDAQYNLILSSGTIPWSLSSFNHTKEGIDILQIQGVYGQNPRVKNWEHLLVELVEEFAKSIDIKTVMIQPAGTNSWVHYEGEEIYSNNGLPINKAIKHYDIPAISRGYQWNPDLNRYVK